MNKSPVDEKTTTTAPGKPQFSAKNFLRFVKPFLIRYNVEEHPTMIAVISPIKEADSGVIVTYPRIAIKRPFGPDAATGGGGGDHDLAPPVHKQVRCIIYMPNLR